MSNNLAEALQSVKYKSVEKPTTSWMPIEEFLDLPPVFCQRQTEWRLPKIKKLMEKKYFQSHLEVAVFEYTSNGHRARGNGKGGGAAAWELARRILLEKRDGLFDACSREDLDRHLGYVSC